MPFSDLQHLTQVCSLSFNGVVIMRSRNSKPFYQWYLVFVMHLNSLLSQWHPFYSETINTRVLRRCRLVYLMCYCSAPTWYSGSSFLNSWTRFRNFLVALSMQMDGVRLHNVHPVIVVTNCGQTMKRHFICLLNAICNTYLVKSRRLINILGLSMQYKTMKSANTECFLT